MRTFPGYFDSTDIDALCSIVKNIEAEKTAAGIPIDDGARGFIAACVMAVAKNGEDDPQAIMAHAFDSAV